MPTAIQRKSTRSRAASIFRRATPSRKLAIAGMTVLTDKFRERTMLHRQQQRKAGARLNGELIELFQVIARRDDVERVIREFGARHRRRPPKDRLLPLPDVASDEAPSTSPLGARVTPPFDFAWTMPGTKAGQGANAKTGGLGFTIDSFGADDYDEIACCSVAIQLAPPVAGRLAVWSNPSYHGYWSNHAFFAASHTEAAIGFWIGRCNQDGTVFEAELVSQYLKLWDDSCHVGDSGEHFENVPGYSLTASCSVDPEHQYIVAVAIFGAASADQIAGGASALSWLTAIVPSISWEIT